MSSAVSTIVLTEAEGLGISFVVCFVVGLVVMLVASPFWYTFATSVLPQVSNKVAVDDKSKDDAEKGQASGSKDGQISETKRSERDSARDREERPKKPRKLEEVKVPSDLDASGIDYTAVFVKHSKDRFTPTLKLVGVNDQHVALLKNLIDSASVITAEYLNQKLIILLCCIHVSLRQLARSSENFKLRDDENKIFAKLLKVSKRLKSNDDAENRDFEKNLPKIIEDSKNMDQKRADEARAKLARLNIQRRLSFVNLLASLREHYRSELQSRVNDEQVEFGMAIVFALLMEGEVLLNKFIKQRLLAVIERNARRFTILQARTVNSNNVDSMLSNAKQAFTDALDYVNSPKVKRANTVVTNPASQQDQSQALTEQQIKDLINQFSGGLRTPLEEATAERSKTKEDTSASLDEKVELQYVEALEIQLDEKDRLLRPDSLDPSEFTGFYKSVMERQEKEIIRLWEKADNLELEDFSRVTEEENLGVMNKLKKFTETFLEKNFQKREDQRAVLNAFLYNLDKSMKTLGGADRSDRRVRDTDSYRKLSDARDRLDEKQLQLFLESTTVLFRRTILEMMEVNVIISEEARAKSKTELDYSINSIWSHVILTKFELEQRVELKLKPEQIKYAATKEAKRAELASKAKQENDKVNEAERASANKKVDEDVNAAMKPDADRLNVLEKSEVLKIRDELLNELEVFTALFEKQINLSIGRYLANQARFEYEETNTDLAHDLLDAVLKRVMQNSSDMGSQAERLLQDYQAGVVGLQSRLDSQRDSKVDRIIESLNKMRKQKESEINDHANRQIKLITKQPDSYTARQFAKLVIEEKAERERDRVGREAMRVELLRYKTILDRKAEEDSKQALQDEKKLLLVRLASLSAASPTDIRRYADAAAIDLPVDTERRKALVDKLVSDFKSGLSKPESY